MTHKAPPVFPTFAAAVRAAASAIKVNIDVRNIEKYLSDNRVKLPKKDARSAIATQLKHLTDSGDLERTQEGAGPIPHRYTVTTR